jgi:hypothetical protein
MCCVRTVRCASRNKEHGTQYVITTGQLHVNVEIITKFVAPVCLTKGRGISVTRHKNSSPPSSAMLKFSYTSIINKLQMRKHLVSFVFRETDRYFLIHHRYRLPISIFITFFFRFCEEPVQYIFNFLQACSRCVSQ